MHSTAPQIYYMYQYSITDTAIVIKDLMCLLSVVRPRLMEAVLFISAAAPLLWNELPDYITNEQTLTLFQNKTYNPPI